MKLKLNLIAGACLAICSVSSFAAVTPLACATPASTSNATAQTFAQNCAPEQTLFIGGASTVKGNIGTLVLANIFDTALMTPVKVIDIGSVSGKDGNALAYYGMSKATLTTTAKRLLVIYNFNNGSAAGVSQLYAKPDAVKVPESDAVMVGPLKANVANTACSTSVAMAAVAGVNPAISASTDAAPTVTCTSHAAQQADLAISDVNANELYAVYDAAAAGKFSTLTATPLVLQSFGVAVSPLLYSALQTQNIADGLLAAGCTAGDTTAACQPSIRSADYASLVSKAGSIKSLAALVPAAGSSAVLTLARRDDLSGTQASSNIFFVNGQCGTDNAKGTVAKAGGLLGGLPIISIADAGTYPSLNILSAVVSGDVKNAVSSATGYAIGVLNVGSGGTVAGTGAGLGRFVKIDGQSPNFVAGTQNSVLPIATGNYPFAMTTFALTVTKANVGETKALTDALIASFKNSTQAQSGLAYFDGVVASKQSLVHRTGGNNCSPLIKG